MISFCICIWIGSKTALERTNSNATEGAVFLFSRLNERKTFGNQKAVRDLENTNVHRHTQKF